MVRSISKVQASPPVKSDRPLGKFATILLMIALCAPLGGYAHWLNAHYDYAATLVELTFFELFLAAILLLLPFVMLRLLRVNWQSER